MSPKSLAAAAALAGAVTLAGLGAGCTPMQWVKADATPEQLDQDSIQCQQDAWREARFRAWYYRPLVPTVLVDRAGRRFLSYGGTLPDPFGDPFLEESRLANFCMRSKGYELVPLEPKQ